MLSYMLPMDEKSALVPNKDHLQLNFTGAKDDNTAVNKSSGDTNLNVNKGIFTPNNDVIATTQPNKLQPKKFCANSCVTNTMVTTNQRVVGAKYHFVSGAGSSTGPAGVINSIGGNISKDSSISSCLSDATTASSMTPTSTVSSDKPKSKILVNGTKHTTLKRVSFGSSKGSMVETLIYESPLQEEPENSPIAERPCHNFPSNQQELSQVDSSELERSKVRVSFFQQSRPQQISPINSTENLLVNLDLPVVPQTIGMASSTVTVTPPGALSATATITDINGHLQYNRQESTDSGWDNPFRPGGELSREAEEIVELIKGGKPITPTPDGTSASANHLLNNQSLDENDHTIHSGGTSPTATPASTVDATSPLTQSPKKQTQLGQSPTKNVLNGVNNKQPGAVDVKRDTVNSPGEAEHIVLKKKPKCKCCVIQ